MNKLLILLRVLTVLTSIVFIGYFIGSFSNPTHLEEGLNYLYASIAIHLITTAIDKLFNKK
jgi:hypothetical protein